MLHFFHFSNVLECSRIHSLTLIVSAKWPFPAISHVTKPLAACETSNSWPFNVTFILSKYDTFLAFGMVQLQLAIIDNLFHQGSYNKKPKPYIDSWTGQGACILCLNDEHEAILRSFGYGRWRKHIYQLYCLRYFPHWQTVTISMLMNVFNTTWIVIIRDRKKSDQRVSSVKQMTPKYSQKIREHNIN